VFQKYIKKIRKMGSDFELIVIQSSASEAELFFDMACREIDRIEALISEFIPDSETSKINNLKKDENISISEETYQLIIRANNISKLCDGDFDITCKPLKALYNFKNQKFVLPNDQDLKHTLNRVGYQKINTSQPNTISFDVNEMSISFAALGKGYAADKVKELWLNNGLKNGVISASGDMTVLGQNIDKQAWNIGIANPDNHTDTLMYVPIHSNTAVATSGNYIQFFELDGKRYGHNINPKNGKPSSFIKSVSVFSPSAELSDALSTAVFVKGVEKGLKFISNLPQTYCIIIDDDNQVHFSNNIALNEINT
jgi:FAD:protein FMN transferase